MKDKTPTIDKYQIFVIERGSGVQWRLNIPYLHIRLISKTKFTLAMFCVTSLIHQNIKMYSEAFKEANQLVVSLSLTYTKTH